MKWLIRITEGFESSSGKTPEFKSFVRLFKNEFKKYLQGLGATNIEIGAGHFYLSGFFDIGDQVWYFSTPDVRYLISSSMLVRTAKHHKDWTGGLNQSAALDHRFDEQFRRIVLRR
jgi:hypothetical protein